eukprot:scaffold180_cov311-Pinguiococcus_pyrenoidosus.AAC.21
MEAQTLNLRKRSRPKAPWKASATSSRESSRSWRTTFCTSTTSSPRCATNWPARSTRYARLVVMHAPISCLTWSVLDGAQHPQRGGGLARHGERAQGALPSAPRRGQHLASVSVQEAHQAEGSERRQQAHDQLCGIRCDASALIPMPTSRFTDLALLNASRTDKIGEHSKAALEEIAANMVDYQVHLQQTAPGPKDRLFLSRGSSR